MLADSGVSRGCPLGHLRGCPTPMWLLRLPHGMETPFREWAGRSACLFVTGPGRCTESLLLHYAGQLQGKGPWTHPGVGGGSETSQI